MEPESSVTMRVFYVVDFPGSIAENTRQKKLIRKDSQKKK